MPNRKAEFEEAPVIRLETKEQLARARAQIETLRDAEPGSVEELLRVSLEAAVEEYAAAMDSSSKD